MDYTADYSWARGDWATEDKIMRRRMRELERGFLLRPWRYLVALALAGYIAVQVGYVPAPLLEPRTPTAIAAIPSGTVVDAVEAQILMDSELLADVAMGEDRNAAVAVMWVVLNRAEGRPVLEAVTEGRAFGSMIRGVFVPSWSLDPYSRWRHPYSIAEFHRLEGVAQAVLLGYISDPTGGATHFHRRGTWTPPWAPTRDEWEQYGVHYFYTGHEG
jgi:hypothetical protein